MITLIVLSTPQHFKRHYMRSCMLDILIFYNNFLLIMTIMSSKLHAISSLTVPIDD